MEFLAHFDKEENYKNLLSEHLNSVARIVKSRLISETNFSLIDKNELFQHIHCAAFFHDSGKYTDYFQNYIRQSKKAKKKNTSNLKNHAHISAWCYNFYEKNQNKKENLLLRFLLYISIKNHHGNLATNKFYYEKMKEKTIKNLLKQKNSIEKNIKKENRNLDIEFNIETLLNMNKKSIKKQYELFQKEVLHKIKSGRINEEQYYFLLIYIFSLLIDIDKLDSGEVNLSNVKAARSSFVTEYLNLITNGQDDNLNINKKREKVRKSVMKKLENLREEELIDKSFFILTAPTGLGKTLTSLQTAFVLQEKIEQIRNYKPRIITAIPFINIIDQTYKEYKNVANDNFNIIKHHRLTDFSKKYDNEENIPLDKSLLELEAWEGDIILTTFVQLFHSIFSSRNRSLKKINKLAGSIVILDEIQSIPEKYLPLIGATLFKISEYYGTRFILMTATQPKILDFGELLLEEEKFEEIKIDLLEKSTKYFNNLKRTKLVPVFNEKSISMDNNMFIELFMEKWSPDYSALIVVNTIKRSIDIYNELVDLKEENNISNEVEIYYLSTNIIPLKRGKVIKTIKSKLKNNKSVILVSTQTIEAGVDVDFDIGFRDLAPLPSIIQTAGRVNREGKKRNFSPVYIVNLESDSSYIYKLYQLEDTKDFLRKKGEIKENSYKEIMDEYYDNSFKRGMKDDSREIWYEGIQKLDFDIVGKFKLIKEIGEVYDVYLEYNYKNDRRKMATNLADLYEELLTCEDYLKFDLNKVFINNKDSIIKYNEKKLSFYEKRSLLRLVLAKMNNYIIQIRLSGPDKNLPLKFEVRNGVESDLYWVPPNQVDEYYDDNTGFKSETGSSLLY